MGKDCYNKSEERLINMANILVIGGGASGMVAAIQAARCGSQVTIFEKNNKCGKKLALTGNGRCNYWNDLMVLEKYHSQDMAILKEILVAKKETVLPFFASIGIIPKVINGYYYPYSLNAGSIINALLTELNNLNVEIKYEEEVKEISKKEKFLIKTNKGLYVADKVIMATGSKAYPKTGSDGLGYEILQNLGHHIVPVLPSLVALKGQDSFYHDWAGLRCEAILSLWENAKKIKEEAGEIQLTDYGISGICTFNLSPFVTRGLKNNQKEAITINFVPWFPGNKVDFKNWLDKQAENLPNFNLYQMLEGFLNYKLINVIFKILKLTKNVKWSRINQDKLVDLLLSFPFLVSGTKDFDSAQVCCGGIPLTEINPETFESLKVKGLYLTGEILDVDGDCGGYNLGFAWMSGLSAGEGASHD